MVTLRLTQSTAGLNRYRVEAALEGDGLPRQIATTEFDFTVTPQDRENLRWYLEDYLEHAADPAPRIAARIEQRMAELGMNFFRALFHSSDDARDLWATLRDRLADTRVEVLTGVREATALPWELLRDPRTDVPLALRAQAFVRAAHQAVQPPPLSQAGSGPIRILLVICRPGGGDDVPFRSVASRLIKGLGQSGRESFELDVLRPPTFAQLGHVLRAAKVEERPYHVVHFDGHGIYDDLHAKYAGQQPKRMRGYLLFENAALQGNQEFVHGALLGKTLAGTGVSLLVLNACRSAHAEAPSAPQQVDAEGTAGPEASARGFGSLAQEVVDAGVAGVVAMRYNVYVVTAAQFVAGLYEALSSGLTLGEAVSRGRKQLHDAPLREVAYKPRPLQDWSVPTVHEAMPIALFSKRAQAPAPLRITMKAGEAAAACGDLDAKLPGQPDTGFFGRDETLLALDRAFDAQPIVLLQAYAGSGKTATAAEFAHWYTSTGGIKGPVLFTSFEQYRPLARVLDQLGERFEGALERSDVHWLTLSDAQRREVALQVLGQVPALWLWDNVEPIAGFPAGTASGWSPAEQDELAEFLRAARQTKAKFLLTSRRDERGWLDDLPARITVPPMPMRERVQLAQALAKKHGRQMTEVEDWQPLLRFTGGNPLTLTVLVGQALRDGLQTKAQVEAFVARLRAGESAFEDEAREGRSKSLAASLKYGFECAFTEAERKQLALLYLFQGFVNVHTLCFMGKPDEEWCVRAVRGLTHEAGMALLDRAAEVGLLTAFGGGHYTIHPALPWFFKSLFEAHYPLEPEPQAALPVSQRSAVRAFVEAMHHLGQFYQGRYVDGNRSMITMLRAEEANLMHSRQLARTHGQWEALIGTMQGLYSLYDHTGRPAEWARLVNEMLPEFVDLKTDGPLPGREEAWDIINQYRVRLAKQARDWTEAERLQRAAVESARRSAVAPLSQPAETLDARQRNDVRSLSASLHELGEIQRESGSAKCVTAYEEALNLATRIGERAGAATCTLNLGHAYRELTCLHDLAQAERLYQQSLELRDERDGLGRGKCFKELGSTAHERFLEAQEAGRPKDELLHHLNTALQFCGKALALLPPDAVQDLAPSHNTLGAIYSAVGDVDHGLSHFCEAIRYYEAAGDLYWAAAIRYNVAAHLASADRFEDAREYAYAALRNYKTFGTRMAPDIERTHSLIAQIEQFL